MVRVSGTATCYGLGGSGIKPRWGAKFSAPTHPASWTTGAGSLSRKRLRLKEEYICTSAPPLSLYGLFEGEFHFYFKRKYCQVGIIRTTWWILRSCASNYTHLLVTATKRRRNVDSSCIFPKHDLNFQDELGNYTAEQRKWMLSRLLNL